MEKAQKFLNVMENLQHHSAEKKTRKGTVCALKVFLLKISKNKGNLKMTPKFLSDEIKFVKIRKRGPFQSI